MSAWAITAAARAQGGGGDLDSDGLDDNWEYFFFGNLSRSGSVALVQGQEYAFEIIQWDDGLSDELDADPFDPAVCWKRTTERGYVLVELPWPFVSSIPYSGWPVYQEPGSWSVAELSEDGLSY